jgi:hypothetical protein
LAKIHTKKFPASIMVNEMFVTLGQSEDLIRKSSLAKLLAEAMSQRESVNNDLSSSLGLTNKIENYFKM